MTTSLNINISRSILLSELVILSKYFCNIKKLFIFPMIIIDTEERIYLPKLWNLWCNSPIDIKNILGNFHCIKNLKICSNDNLDENFFKSIKLSTFSTSNIPQLMKFSSFLTSLRSLFLSGFKDLDLVTILPNLKKLKILELEYTDYDY